MSENFSRRPIASTDPVRSRSFEKHQISFIDDGFLSLAKRVRMIESAKETIELEFFIYQIDHSSKIITAKLIEAANRGVKVRLLVDFAAPVFRLRPAYAALLGKENIKVRYYNTVGTHLIVSVQHRNHRKLLIVDGHKVITGGRNIGDEYFDLADEYNFLDSDVYVEGPIVKDIQSSFNVYWNSEYSIDPDTEGEVVAEQAVVDFFNFSSMDKALLNKLKALRAADELEKRARECSDLTFVTDYPGVSVSNRLVFKEIASFLQEAREELLGESPYFVLRRDGLDLLQSLSDRGIKQRVLTNSLYSTDAYYTVSAMISALPKLKSMDFDLRLYDGSAPEKLYYSNGTMSKRWGLHAKRAVVDRKHILIGTYNVDPRSANFNSELILICRNSPDLASIMVESLESRADNSWVVFDGETHHHLRLLKRSSSFQIALFILALPLSRMFDFLL